MIGINVALVQIHDLENCYDTARTRPYESELTAPPLLLKIEIFLL